MDVYATIPSKIWLNLKPWILATQKHMDFGIIPCIYSLIRG